MLWTDWITPKRSSFLWTPAARMVKHRPWVSASGLASTPAVGSKCISKTHVTVPCDLSIQYFPRFSCSITLLICRESFVYRTSDFLMKQTAPATHLGPLNRTTDWCSPSFSTNSALFLILRESTFVWRVLPWTLASLRSSLHRSMFDKSECT